MLRSMAVGERPWVHAMEHRRRRTDFSWCQPYFTGATNSSGNLVEGGCASSSTSQGSPAYWNTSNNGTTGASAAGYVPEIPWNDSCEIHQRQIPEHALFCLRFQCLFRCQLQHSGGILQHALRTIQGYPGWYQLYQGIGADCPAFVDSSAAAAAQADALPTPLTLRHHAWGLHNGSHQHWHHHQ